jgi:hypothetical protein
MNLLTSLYLRWRYRILLATLLLVLVVQPLSFGFSTPPQLFDAFLMLVTMALLLSFCQDKNKLLVAVAFGLARRPETQPLPPCFGCPPLYSSRENGVFVSLAWCLL